MSFPYHDKLWVETADFVLKERKDSPEDKKESGANGGGDDDDLILAPDPFWRRFDKIYTHDATFRDPYLTYDWAVIHKGQLSAISVWALARIEADMAPVLANEVFVVFSRADDLEPLDTSDPHLRSFAALLARRRNNTDSGPAEDHATEPSAVRHSEVVPEPGTLFKFERLTLAGLRDAMNDFYTNGGYEFLSLRDTTLRAEGKRKTAILLPDCRDKWVLDIGAGGGFVSDLVADAECFVGIDLADVALQQIVDKSDSSARIGVAVMDAETLGFPDETFDVVTCIETVEHVFDAEAMLGEISRVLRPGGVLVADFANRDSLHLILNRKLGYDDFTSTTQHIREFNLGELDTALDAVGLLADRIDGAFLYPYFGVPGIDEVVRPVVDDDPDAVEALRLLGDRGGPEYA